jgi:hypothetical protein
MVRYRRVTKGGVPPPEEDSENAAALSELAGRSMVDADLVYETGRSLQFSDWAKEYCFGLACNIAFANLEDLCA